MWFDLSSFIKNLSFEYTIWAVVTLGVFFPVFFLWSNLKKKEDSDFYRPEHVFDFVLFSLLFGIMLSRLGYILFNIESFSGVGWFWLPYEKLENQTFWFDRFPWLFFKMNLNTVLLEGFVAGFYFGMSFARGIHKFSWKEVSTALSDYVGLSTTFGCLVAYIFYRQEVLVYPVLVLFILFLAKELTKKSFDIFRELTASIWKFSAVVSMPVVVLFYRLRTCCIISRDIIALVLMFTVCIFFIIKILWVRKGGKPVNRAKLEKKRRPAPLLKRNYSLSYRTLSGNWWNRLISRFHSKGEDPSDQQ